MKKAIELWELVGFAVTSLLGTILHFLYDWTGRSFLIAPFSSINESTWEHMKLLFWPMFLYAIIQSLFFKDFTSFWCIKLKGISLGLILIPIIFYTYNGIIGKSPDWVNIMIFFIAAAITYIYETKKLKESSTFCIGSKFSVFLLLIIAFSFIIFTFSTPSLSIFKDPISTIGI